ncbi:RNA pseudouridine synthase [endosymbiont 'TC1' of Trimyema compressum]|uniref:RluA family pseudouridine synthase n=1 Tax=endosymbiont 'TC1' of Trimyema compressum TaxID=243899 RepID=UPI0007F06B66|nr:RluA family pseudouridine synthase [endosymbiont 'TC1' of Trimyema compressum]AMP20185.1 RNA pseudouridine synthase [endosymbiont 'TC1' of Trimyema compressum]
MEIKEIPILREERIDKYLSNYLSFSRSHIEKLIEDGSVTVNGQTVKKRYVLSFRDQVLVEMIAPEAIHICPEKMPLDILYEDDAILVVNKDRGIVVHPAPGHYKGTLVNGLLNYDIPLSSINGFMRPGIVHRIDKDTSGILVITKTDEAHEGLAVQFKEHTIKRQYMALVNGIIDERSGEIDLPIGRDPKSRIKMSVLAQGKGAKTYYEVEEKLANNTLLLCTLHTGRTHQIRVHLAYLKHPVAGDPLYGTATKKIPLDGQYLHAITLGFMHPISQEYLEFKTSLPLYFQQLLNKLREG